MADLKDLIAAIDINDLKFQLLTQGHADLTVRGKKDGKYLEVKFQTDAEHIAEKEAIIIWVDKPKLQSAIDAVRSRS